MRVPKVFDGRFRQAVDRGLKPVGKSLRTGGLTADQLTIAGVVFSVCFAVAMGSGRVGVAGAFYAMAALPDLLDGPVARAGGQVGPRGAFLDSVADRVTDCLLLGGIAWYLQARNGGKAAMLAVAVLAIGALIPYMRAKAESLGFDAKGGLMERAERIILLAFGVAVTRLLVPILWVLLVLSTVTALQRFVKVWRQASNRAPRRRVWTTERLEAWRLQTSETFRSRREATAVRRAERRAERLGRRAGRRSRP